MNKRILSLLLVLIVLQASLIAYQSWRLAQANYGDMSHDGVVNARDLSIMARHWGKRDPYAL